MGTIVVFKLELGIYPILQQLLRKKCFSRFKRVKGLQCSKRGCPH